jgi:hypothetical protein
MITEYYRYDLVVPKLSKGKRNFIVVGGFFAGVSLIVLVYLLTDVIIPILWFAIVYGLVLMALSGSLLRLEKIGKVTFDSDHILLENPGLNMERSIPITEVKNAFTRKGLAKNMVIAVKRKSLIVDIVTLTDEPVSMQIEVKESDIKTTDYLEKYFSANNISFNRKI